MRPRSPSAVIALLALTPALAPAALSYSTSTNGFIAAYTSYNPSNTSIRDTSQITGPNVFRNFSSPAAQQSASTYGDAGSSTLDFNDTLNSPVGDGTFIPITWHAHSSAAANATANLGTLHAFASASQGLQDFHNSYQQTDPDSGLTFSTDKTNPLIAVGHGAAGAASSETFSLTSPSLSPGATVQLRIRMSVDANLTAVGDNSAAKVTAQGYAFVQRGFNSYDSDAANYNSDYDGPSKTIDVLFGAPVGATITLYQSLDADALVQDFVPNTSLDTKVATSSASADASNTAHFYLDIVDGSDATLTSSSGANYSFPLPEPSTLTAALLLALPARRRRR